MYRVIKTLLRSLLLLFILMELLCWFDIAARLHINIANLENIDTTFMAKANNDFNISQQDVTTQVAAITTRDIQAIDNPTAGIFQTVDIPEAFRIDAKPFIERPFYCDTVEFKTTSDQYSLLDTKIKYLPGDVARSNTSLLNMFKMAALGRPDLVLNISMAGTISHAGCILAGIIPPMPAVGGTAFIQGNVPQLVNTIMSGPHAFLNANEATSVTLHAPWFCNNDLMSLDFEKTTATYKSAVDLNYVSGNYGTLVLMVLNKLTAAAGASTEVDIVIEACFKNFDMVVPTPRFLEWSANARKPTPGGFINSLRGFTTGLFDYTTNGLKSVATDGLDSVRGWLRSWTGLHNPNLAVIDHRAIVAPGNFMNNTSSPQFLEKLDYNPLFSRVIKEPVFGNDVDEMSISHITSKDQYLGTFDVKTTDDVGVCTWIRPISPFSGGKLLTLGDPPLQYKILRCSNNLDLLHSVTRAWRGGLKLKIQSVMNNKQQVKLKLIKYYNPSLNVLSQVPQYRSIVNAPSHLLEFTQGGQMHEVKLPYLCRNELTPCHDDTSFEALYHGVYYIYIAQPLCVADGSPTTVSFNVYISGDDDLAFYGQNIRPLVHQDWNLLALDPGIIAEPDVDGEEDNFVPESGVVKGMEVMNSPQQQIQAMGEDNKEAMAQYCNRLLPLVDIRPIVRRMAVVFEKVQTVVPPGKEISRKLDLATFVGERRIGTGDTNNTYFDMQPLELVSTMYYGKTPGFKIRVESYLQVKVTDETPNPLDEVKRLSIKAYYVPPQISRGQQGLQGLWQSSFNNIVAQSTVPVPLIASNVLFNGTSYTFEVEVPFTHLMKFMGSPDKFRDLAEALNSSSKTTANSDLGNVLIIYANNDFQKEATVLSNIYVGVNDETRFGMHSIAPVFLRQPSDSMYSTDVSGVVQTPQNTLLASLYKGGYTA